MSAQKSQKHAQCTQMEAQVIHSERKRDSATNIKKEYVRNKKKVTTLFLKDFKVEGQR